MPPYEIYALFLLQSLTAQDLYIHRQENCSGALVSPLQEEAELGNGTSQVFAYMN
jgi:hypothetical protein